MTSRRRFLQSALAVTLGFRGLKSLFAAGAPAQSAALGAADNCGLGPLVPDVNGILDLPKGFHYQILSRAGDRMDDGLWVPGKPDGMAAFMGPAGKTILIRNHELLADKAELGPYGPDNALLRQIPNEFIYDRARGIQPCLGGTTTLLYDTSSKKLERQYLSLAGTQYNCAGGPTPWGTWITCEEDVQRADDTFEKDHGFAFEVPANIDGRLARPVPLTAMGRFRREAIAVDPRTGIAYQTEDRPDGLLYRFLPAERGKLAMGGRVQALAIRGQKSLDTRNWHAEDGTALGPSITIGAKFTAEWVDIDNVLAPEDDLRLRGFERGAARFARQEGIWFGHQAVYFACTEGGRIRKGQIWKYSPSREEGTSREQDSPGSLELFLEPNDPSLVENADNLTIAPWGDLVVCEDGAGEQFVVGVTTVGQVYKIAKNAASTSEFAGATFSPDGETLFVNMQSAGYTFAISGPWNSGPKSG